MQVASLVFIVLIIVLGTSYSLNEKNPVHSQVHAAPASLVNMFVTLAPRTGEHRRT